MVKNYLGVVSSSFFFFFKNYLKFFPRKFYFLFLFTEFEKIISNYFNFKFLKDLKIYGIFSFLFSDIFRFSYFKYMLFFFIYKKFSVFYHKLKLKGLGVYLVYVSFCFLKFFFGLNIFFYFHLVKNLFFKVRGRLFFIFGFGNDYIGIVISSFKSLFKRNNYKKFDYFFFREVIKFYKKKLIH